MSNNRPKLLALMLEGERFKAKEIELIQKAYDFAAKAHEGQKRTSGEAYITHPLEAAYFLYDLGMDATTIAACLLHDTLEDTGTTVKDLGKEFGTEIAFLVSGVTKLGKIEYSAQPSNKQKGAIDRYMGSLKKMFLAMAEDIRVILIKLADRYHNMQTLSCMPQESQRRIAQETLEIYAPIAARLGIGKLKGQLEDLAFPYVYPAEYRWLIKNIREKYTDRINYINRTKPVIKRHLTDAGIQVIDLHSRAKHYWSLYQKVLRQQIDMDKIFDLVAMRIVVPDVKSCYEALGIIHKHYKPLPARIKDYIALPKPNGYRSLHTTVFCEKGRIVEIQIRTPEMHEHAENGIAAHWAYSEGGKKINTKANAGDIPWVTQLKNIIQDIKPSEGLSNIKIDFFKSRIFAFTPLGEVKDLPEGATPIDFAYAVHTELGHCLEGAKVNGKIVPLEYTLQNGDVVEIIKKKIPKPSFDWLKMVKTNEARRKIKVWFHSQEQKDEEVQEKKITRRPTKKLPVTATAKLGQPIIAGQTGFLYRIAKCCHPTTEDKIIGYLTLNQGVSIHHINCKNLKSADKRRLLKSSWA